MNVAAGPPLTDQARARVVRSLCAAGLAGVLLGAVLGVSFGVLRVDPPIQATPGYALGVCRPTPVTERRDGGPGFPSPVRLVIGGALAGPPLNGVKGYPTSMSPGDYWHLRDAERRPSITLSAERLDEPAVLTTFTAVGYPLGEGFPAEWSPAKWYYRTAVEALGTLPVKGCWRISLVGGSADDAVIYDLKLAPENRPR